MPLYEYNCHECNATFEKILSKATDDPQPCPKCGTPSPQQLAAPSPFQWGSGRPWNA